MTWWGCCGSWWVAIGSAHSSASAGGWLCRRTSLEGSACPCLHARSHGTPAPLLLLPVPCARHLLGRRAGVLLLTGGPARAGCRGPHPRCRTCLIRQPRGHCARRTRRSPRRPYPSASTPASRGRRRMSAGTRRRPRRTRRTSRRPARPTGGSGAAATCSLALCSFPVTIHKSGGTAISGLTDVQPERPAAPRALGPLRPEYRRRTVRRALLVPLDQWHH